MVSNVNYVDVQAESHSENLNCNHEFNQSFVKHTPSPLRTKYPRFSDPKVQNEQKELLQIELLRSQLKSEDLKHKVSLLKARHELRTAGIPQSEIDTILPLLEP